LISSTISGISVQNSPVQVFSVDNSQNLTLSDITIDDSDGDDAGAANTDALTSVTVQESSSLLLPSTTRTIVLRSILEQYVPSYLLPDWRNIANGKILENITFTGGLCSGGHGLSIGSVGGRNDNTVSGVLIESSQIKSSQNGDFSFPSCSEGLITHLSRRSDQDRV
jgi:hypothetical protein